MVIGYYHLDNKVRLLEAYWLQFFKFPLADDYNIKSIFIGWWLEIEPDWVVKYINYCSIGG